MSQATTWGVPVVGPSTPVNQAQREMDSLNALLSNHSGSARPTYAVAGTIWADTSVAGKISCKLYDGAADRLLYTVDTSTGVKTFSGIDPAQVFATKAADYTAVAADNNAFHTFSGASPTLSLTAPGTLGASWHYDGYAAGGPLVVTPVSGLINGAASITVPQLSNFSIKCDGTGFLCLIDSQTAAQIQQISASVATNQLTLGFTPQGPVSFRNPSLTLGTPVSTNIAGGLSLVVPAGATLGTVSGQKEVLALLLAYNGGSPALVVINTDGGLVLDETGLISTTAISAGATSASTFYSTAAITNSPYRVLGTITLTQATAGTWATAPSLIQGAGGQTLTRAIPAKSQIRLNTPNGYGSTNTKIRRFLNVVENQCPDVTYADSATLGASFTVQYERRICN